MMSQNYVAETTKGKGKEKFKKKNNNFNNLSGKQFADLPKLGCLDVFMGSGGKSNFLLVVQPIF